MKDRVVLVPLAGDDPPREPGVLALVVVFAAYYLITRPQDAATLVQGAFGAVFTATDAIGQFFSSLAS